MLFGDSLRKSPRRKGTPLIIRNFKGKCHGVIRFQLSVLQSFVLPAGRAIGPISRFRYLSFGLAGGNEIAHIIG